MYNTIALIVAAGSGTRFGDVGNKLLQLVNNKPILVQVLESFVLHPLIDKICVVLKERLLQDYQEILKDFPAIDGVIGGLTRKDSVYCGLQAIAKYEPHKVLIHDAARPFVRRELISEVVEALEYHEAVDVLVPVVDTLKKFDNEQLVIIPRENLYQTQTPQGFRFDHLYQLHQNSDTAPHDDITLFIARGLKVGYVIGAAYNYKITFKDDI